MGETHRRSNAHPSHISVPSPPLSGQTNPKKPRVKLVPFLVPTVEDLLHLLIKQQRPSRCSHSPLLCSNKGNSPATKVPRGLKRSPSHQSPPWDTAAPRSSLLLVSSPECNSTETLCNSFKVTAERTRNKTTSFQRDTASEQRNFQRGGRQIFPAHLKEVPGFQFEGTTFKNSFFT